jgi:threonyl-tRNA synthetase
MKAMAKQNLPYRREDIEKAKILDIFEKREEPLKRELIDEKVEDVASVYYIDNSPFIDFCLGPHVPHTGKLQAFKLLALSGAYWKGDANNPQMQRIYGTAFATQAELDAWLKQREEAEKRDHRKLGRELDLFSISDDYGPGLILWHPKGGIVRMEMERLLREELVSRGYSFVFTPHIAKRDLWRVSGHEENYADSMYAPTSIEDEEYRLKPMNCPLHIGIYKSSPRSYRDLPQRYSEAGMVYRAELSGTLHGLMRVRGFTVDDAHLFVRPDQIHREIADCLDFAIKVFETYGFDKVKFELSVRGGAENKGYLGSEDQWAAAEAQLRSALKEEYLIRTHRRRGRLLRTEDRH